ncbi:hypothetical protein [Novosphingobium rosa]|uniref:hypothetical protein n=1 Tax=Novosphingobium rosa TaxID=76978 RepID=UPI000B091575|nr:hypothetical protein [Novosphingobium rosa]
MSNPDAVLTALEADLGSTTAREAVEANRGDLLAAFRASELNNYRSLRAALGDFDRLVERADPKLTDKPQALKALLLLMVAIGMEIRADRLSLDQLEKLGSRSNPAAGGAPNETEKNLAKRYPMIDWGAPLIAPRLIGKLTASGTLSLSEINATLAEHPLIVGYRAAPLWRSMYDWMYMKASVYTSLRAETIKRFAEHEVTNPGEILHFAGVALGIAKCGDIIFPDIEKTFCDYINGLVEKGTLEPEISVFNGIDAESWGQCGYQEQDDAAFEAIKKHLRRAVEGMHRQELRGKASAVLEHLRSEGTYIALTDADEPNGGYGGAAILQFIPVEDFSDLLIDDDLIDRNLFAALEERYSKGRVYPELAEEAGWLESLEERLWEKANAAPAPFKGILTARLNARLPAIKQLMDDLVKRVWK